MTSWAAPPADLALAGDEVHVWRTGLDVDPATRDQLAAALGEDERCRAAAFRFARDAERFIAGHGALRVVLGRYLGLAPRDVRLAAGPAGKPELAGGGDITFNLSHAAQLAVWAVARRRRVGIDVEQVRGDRADEGVAARVFTQREAARLAAAGGAGRTAVFFDLWTRKEAYAKALGVGLEASGELDVAVEPAGFRFVPLAVAPGFAATLAVEGEQCRMSCWELAV